MWLRRDQRPALALVEARLKRWRSGVAATQRPWGRNPARMAVAEARAVARELARAPRRLRASVRSRSRNWVVLRVERHRRASPARPLRHPEPELRALRMGRAGRPDHRSAQPRAEPRQARSPATVLTEAQCRRADQCRRRGRSSGCPSRRPALARARIHPPANGQAPPRCSRREARRPTRGRRWSGQSGHISPALEGVGRTFWASVSHGQRRTAQLSVPGSAGEPRCAPRGAKRCGRECGSRLAAPV